MSQALQGGALLDVGRMAGPQRAAALLLAMEKTTAQSLLKHFSPDELRLVTIGAAKLGSLPHAALDQLVERFSQEFADAYLKFVLQVQCHLGETGEAPLAG